MHGSKWDAGALAWLAMPNYQLQVLRAAVETKNPCMRRRLRLGSSAQLESTYREQKGPCWYFLPISCRVRPLVVSGCNASQGLRRKLPLVTGWCGCVGSLRLCWLGRGGRVTGVLVGSRPWCCGCERGGPGGSPPARGPRIGGPVQTPGGPRLWLVDPILWKGR